MTHVDILGYLTLVGLIITFLFAIPKVTQIVGSTTLFGTFFATLLIYFIYEAVMPGNMNMRVDRFIIWPCFVIVFSCVLLRVKKLNK